PSPEGASGHELRARLGRYRPQPEAGAPASARTGPDGEVAGAALRVGAPNRPDEMGFSSLWAGGAAHALDLGGVSGAAPDPGAKRHPLCHALESVRQHVA